MPIRVPRLPGRLVGGGSGPVSSLASLLAGLGPVPSGLGPGMHQFGGVPGGLVQGAGGGVPLVPAGPSRFVPPAGGSYAPSPYAPVLPGRVSGGLPYAAAGGGVPFDGGYGGLVRLLEDLVRRSRRGARFE